MERPIFIKIKTNRCQQGAGAQLGEGSRKPSNVLIGAWIWSKRGISASSLFTTIMHSAFLAAFSLMDALVVYI